MRSSEIVSLRAALRYLRRGDDPAKRRRLACILLARLTPWILFATAMAISLDAIK